VFAASIGSYPASTISSAFVHLGSQVRTLLLAASGEALQDGAVGPHGPNVARPAPPDAEEQIRRTARNARPGAAVPVLDCAEGPDGPDVARAGAPDAREAIRRGARNARPGAAVPVLDGALFADGPGDNVPDKVRPVPPEGVKILESDRQELQTGVETLGQTSLASLPQTPKRLFPWGKGFRQCQFPVSQAEAVPRLRPVTFSAFTVTAMLAGLKASPALDGSPPNPTRTNPPAQAASAMCLRNACMEASSPEPALLQWSLAQSFHSTEQGAE